MNTYKINIYERYKDLKNSNKTIDNNDLWKIFEWLTCIKLTKKYDTPFYEYGDKTHFVCFTSFSSFHSRFQHVEENNGMSRYDTGIDAKHPLCVSRTLPAISMLKCWKRE
jgi:hypothetical protein